MKKRVLFSIFASITLTACFACGCDVTEDGLSIIDGDTTSKDAVLSVFGYRTDRASLNVIENTLQGFMSEYENVNVIYESAPSISYWQALDRRSSSGNLDDVFMIDRDRLIAMADELAPITDAVNKNNFSDFAKSQLYFENGELCAVPTAITTYGLYLNYDILQKYGERVPQDYTEFTAVCKNFKEKGITPIICNNNSSLRSLILARGLFDTYYNDDTDIKIAQFNKTPTEIAEPLYDGIDFVYEMIKDGLIDISQASATTDLSGDLQQFATAEYPFMITGGWASTTLRQMLEENGKSLNYDIRPYYLNNGNSVLVAQTDFICMKKGAKANSKELISFLATPEALKRLSLGQSCFSPVKGANYIREADSAIVPSTPYLNGVNVVNGSDANLKIPLDTYLAECVNMILDSEEKDAVKMHLFTLLEGAGK